MIAPRISRRSCHLIRTRTGAASDLSGLRSEKRIRNKSSQLPIPISFGIPRRSPATGQDPERNWYQSPLRFNTIQMPSNRDAQ